MSFITTRFPRLLTGTVCGVLCAFASMFATAAPTAEEAAIRHVIQSTWDTPQARVEVEPVVVVGRHAVAGWTQGPRGGRALMVLGKDGRWAVTVCAGDALKDAKVLESAGLSAAEAGQLSAALVRAEQSVPASRLAQFASFGGLVHMGGHAAPAASAAHH
jgi:hypothetical protein